ncbi:MAG: DUF4430 domain-containing protein [Pirellulales bacterium]
MKLLNGVPTSARRALLALSVMGLLLLAPTATTARGAEPKPATVRLIVDYGDGVQTHFTALPWHEGMTVLDALTAAGKHARGIKFSKRGSGGAAMITQISDAKNEGGSLDSKNWLYYVNDEQGKVSAGKHALRAGDTALWRFQVYDYNP